MVRISAGAGLRKQAGVGFNTKTRTMNSDYGKQKPNPGHFGRLKNPSRTHFLDLKQRTCLGKRGRVVTLTLVNVCFLQDG